MIYSYAYIFFFFSECRLPTIFFFFFFNDTATTEIYTLSLHDALPISARRGLRLHPQADRSRLLRRVVAPCDREARAEPPGQGPAAGGGAPPQRTRGDRRGAHARAAEDEQGHREPSAIFDGRDWADGEDCRADQAGGRLPAHRPRLV